MEISKSMGLPEAILRQQWKNDKGGRGKTASFLAFFNFDRIYFLKYKE